MRTNTESQTISFTKEELAKLASLIAESGKVMQKQAEISRNLLSDNEKMAEELREMKEEKHATDRKNTINKIAEMLNEQGFISKTAMPQKIKELDNMTDEALGQLKDTIHGLSGTPAEKMASEGTFSTLDFLSVDLYTESAGDGKPRPFTLD